MISTFQFAVVICTGSYHTPLPYQAMMDHLAARGIESHCPQRPSCDLKNLNVGDVNNPDFSREPPAGGYPPAAADAAVVGDVLDRLIDEGKSVVLVGHSSGGWVAAEAAKPERQVQNRALIGKPGGVVGIFLYGAFIIPAGESVTTFFAKAGTSNDTSHWLKFHENGLVTPLDTHLHLFSDVDEETGKKWGATLTAEAFMTSPLTHDPWSALPCAYVVMERDAILPPAYQEGMIAAQSQTSGRTFKVYRAPYGHEPNVSWPEGLAEKIEEFGREVLAQ
ncbi:alpha/beta-hydrolase [Aspergillus avenaceus]|uniref:Alpha/beta-hydrolase n=1 Tax=Aspergillus avenaceus TaxID=36643 RepID=A0A5N6U371_ASPAV|nr:alpha/beta-hydrolase [Aspergillus avenaceus]